MRYKLKIYLLFSFIILTVFSVGCKSARELNELVIVMGIGIDADTENTDQIKIVAQVVLPDKISSSESASSSSGKPYSNVESAAANTFEAIREFTHVLTGKLYISHNQILLISREMAERGISPYLDFFIRAKETRPTTKIIIADTTAKDVLEIQPQLGKLPANYLNKLVGAQAANSHVYEVNIIDYINAMQNKTSSFVAPIARIETNGDQQMQSIRGMAVFKEDKMVGELGKDETRGLLWVNGWVETGTINIDIYDGIASLEILNATSDVTPVLSDGNITMRIKISAQTVLVEQTCKENLETRENLKMVEKLAGDVVAQKINAAFIKAKELQADIFGFDALMHKHYPKEWKDMEGSWAEIFQTITLDMDVEVSIKAAGTIEQPAWSTDNEQR